MLWNKIKQKIKSVYKGFEIKLKRSPLYWRTLVVLLFMALIFKWIIIYTTYKNLNPLENIVSYIASDIIIVFLAHLILIINYCIKSRKCRLINDIILFIILILYIIDIFTIFVFNSRVALVDMFWLWSNWSAWFWWIIRLWMFAFIIIWLLVFYLIQDKTKYSKKIWKNTIITFSIFLIVYALFYGIIVFSNINIKYVENIISLNIDSIRWYNVDLVDTEQTENLLKWYSIKNIQWEWKDLNVIMVFAESISAIDSANAGWNDRMPKFDQIQKNWITFTNFIANWTTSDTAHISTLLGVIPLVNMKMWNTPYSGYKLKMEPLPEYLNKQWYATTFLSAASLSFLKQRDFLSWAGFQKIIWEEEFEKDKKYVFEAAPDGELYDRVLQEVQVQTWKYFIWLQTISYHKPYNTPLWKTEEKALQYSDEELFRFYKWLQDLGFFDNWILVILWDHRKMNPSEENEPEIMWPNRYTRSVATVVWSWINAWTVDSNIIQHTDFYNSLKRLLWKGSVKTDRLYNDIFTQKINRDRWITNSEYHESNRYTISSLSWDTFLFKSISSLPKDSVIYDYFSSYVSFEFDNEKTWNSSNKIKFIWHRWANVSNKSPENTLESFLSANSLWADGIEFDVSYTNDGENIVVHWDKLYTSNCRRQKVWDLDYEWINKNCTLDNGEKYRTLKKMLELVDWLFDYYFLEIKVYDEELWAKQTMEAIQTVKDLNMQDRVIFISYSDSAREVLNSDPDIIFGWDTFDVNDLDFIWENNSKYFLAPYESLTPEIVEKAKSLWKEVVTYTINETWDFQAMKDLWIKFIMSDKLELLQEYNSIIQYPIPHNLEKINMKKSSAVTTEDSTN